MDVSAMTALHDAGLETEKATTAVDLCATAKAVDRAEADGQPLPPNVALMLHLIFGTD